MRSIDLFPVSDLGCRSSKLVKHLEHSQSSRIDHFVRDQIICHGLHHPAWSLLAVEHPLLCQVIVLWSTLLF